MELAAQPTWHLNDVLIEDPPPAGFQRNHKTPNVSLRLLQPPGKLPAAERVQRSAQLHQAIHQWMNAAIGLLLKDNVMDRMNALALGVCARAGVCFACLRQQE